jgi:hypothetical protein
VSDTLSDWHFHDLRHKEASERELSAFKSFLGKRELILSWRIEDLLDSARRPYAFELFHLFTLFLVRF